MADVKISQLTAKAAKVESTDRIPIADFNGTTYDTKYVTGAQINELSLDTSPQLGGNLDVNGHTITSDSDQDVIINPNGTGITKIESNLVLRDSAGATAKEVLFYEGFSNGTNYVGLKAADSLTANTTYTLPTADGTSGQVLSTNGTGTLSWTNNDSGLTINSTAISSGTAGRVLFQNASNQLSQSANLFWDNTNNRLGINIATPTVSLDVVGSVKIDNTSFTGACVTISKTANNTNRITSGPTGAEYIQFGASNQILLNASSVTCSNDIFVGNSILTTINNSTGLLINNTGLIQNNVTRTGLTLQTKAWRNDGAGGTSTMNAVKITPTADMTVGTTTGNVLLIDPTINTTGGTHTIRGLYYNPTLTSITGVTHRAIETTTGSVIFNSTSGNVAIGGTSFGTSSDKVLAQYTGTAPGSSPADAYQQYSADITAGNAAPHFRTENGNVVKLYQETTGVAAATLVSNAGTSLTSTDTFDGYTLQQVVKALRNLGILA